MSRARDDRYDHYFPTPPSKRRRGGGQSSVDVERYNPSRDIDFNGPYSQTSKGHWNSGSYIPNLPTQKLDAYEKSSDHIHYDRKQNFVEDINAHTQTERGRQVLEAPNSQNEYRGQKGASQDPRSQFEKKNKSSKKPNAHTLHERKNNPSTRIYGLRKQLAGSNLPPNVRIEKERELASLLFDQQKDKVAKNTRQMISRYHQVRFFERKRAQKRLNKAIKERDACIQADTVKNSDGSKDDGGPEQLKQLEQQIRDARVDLNYTIYAPLTEKYIGLFADNAGDRRAQIKRERNEAKTIDMPEDDKSMLTTRQKEELQKNQKDESQKKQQDQAQIMRLADRSIRPPMWFEVEKIMYPPPSSSNKTGGEIDLDNPPTSNAEQLDKEVMNRLSLLREGRLSTHTNGPRDKELKLVHGPSKKAAAAAVAERKKKDAEKRGQKRKLGEHDHGDDDKNAERMPWMNEDERINPMDVDEESDDEVEAGGGMRLGPGKGDEKDSDSESDGDGGFFER